MDSSSVLTFACNFNDLSTAHKIPGKACDFKHLHPFPEQSVPWPAGQSKIAASLASYIENDTLDRLMPSSDRLMTS